MKKLLALVAFTTVAACGTAQNESNVAGVPNSPILRGRPAVLPELMVFSRDARPADGLLVELTLKKNPLTDGGYDIVLRKAWVDRINGKAVEQKRQIGFGLDCFGDATNGITCSRDMRPADGALTVLTLTPNEGAFDATLRTVIVDRMTGKDHESNETLGEGLKLEDSELVGANPLPVCAAVVGVVVNPETRECRAFRNGCQQSSLMAEGFTELGEGISCAK